MTIQECCPTFFDLAFARSSALRRISDFLSVTPDGDVCPDVALPEKRFSLVFSSSSLSCRRSKRRRASVARFVFQISENGFVPEMFFSSMQSTGHFGMHNSQPVQKSFMTVCIIFPVPIIASTGQACMQMVQPVHFDSSMTAIEKGFSSPRLVSGGNSSRRSNWASFFIPVRPPVVHRLRGTSLSARARA